MQVPLKVSVRWIFAAAAAQMDVLKITLLGPRGCWLGLETYYIVRMYYIHSVDFSAFGPEFQVSFGPNFGAKTSKTMIGTVGSRKTKSGPKINTDCEHTRAFFLGVLAKTQFVQNAKTQFENAKTQFEN